MSEIWKPQEISVYLDWTEAIYSENEKLTEWETRFLASIHERLSDGRNLTQAQADKLEAIYAEKTK